MMNWIKCEIQVQQTVAEKTSALEAEAFKTKRMQVEFKFLFTHNGFVLLLKN